MVGFLVSVEFGKHTFWNWNAGIECGGDFRLGFLLIGRSRIRIRREAVYSAGEQHFEPSFKLNSSSSFRVGITERWSVAVATEFLSI